MIPDGAGSRPDPRVEVAAEGPAIDIPAVAFHCGLQPHLDGELTNAAPTHRRRRERGADREDQSDLQIGTVCELAAELEAPWARSDEEPWRGRAVEQEHE